MAESESESVPFLTDKRHFSTFSLRQTRGKIEERTAQAAGCQNDRSTAASLGRRPELGASGVTYTQRCAARAKVQRRLKCDTRSRCHLYPCTPKAPKPKKQKSWQKTSTSRERSRRRKAAKGKKRKKRKIERNEPSCCCRRCCTGNFVTRFDGQPAHMRERAFPPPTDSEGGISAALSRAASLSLSRGKMPFETIHFAYELEHKTETKPKQSGEPKGI